MTAVTTWGILNTPVVRKLFYSNITLCCRFWSQTRLMQGLVTLFRSWQVCWEFQLNVIQRTVKLEGCTHAWKKMSRDSPCLGAGISEATCACSDVIVVLMFIIVSLCSAIVVIKSVIVVLMPVISKVLVASKAKSWRQTSNILIIVDSIEEQFHRCWLDQRSRMPCENIVLCSTTCYLWCLVRSLSELAAVLLRHEVWPASLSHSGQQPNDVEIIMNVIITT